MKHFRFIALLLLLNSMAFAQNGKRSPDTLAEPTTWQAGIFGGISLPLCGYKTLPEKATPGFTGGVFVDMYFKGNRLGIGADVRYLQHGLGKSDSVRFANGSIYRSPYDASHPLNAQHFSYFAFTVGPTYKIINSSPKVELEAYLRGGIVLQHFPDYLKTLSSVNTDGLKTTFPIGQAYSDKNLPSWAGIGGLRLTGKISPVLGLFVQTDYIRTFGKTWGGDNNRFTYDYQTQLKPITGNTTIVNPITQGYFTSTPGFADVSSVNMQALNITIGLKYTFVHHKPMPKALPVPEVIVPVPVIITKDIQVIAKDKLTGQVLEGVTVIIVHDKNTYTSLTNIKGEAEKIKKAIEGNYTINGSKNNIQAIPVQITAEDFNNTAGPTIYKEIYIEDLRFTLNGVTLNCESGSPLPNVITALKNRITKAVVNCTSDSNGRFTFTLEPNTDYTVVANQKGKFSQTELLSTNGLNRSATMFVTLNLKLCDIAKDKVFELKNILYDFDKADIRPDAALVLENLVTILQQNPGMYIELSSHTDSRGSDAYNMKLSDRRAKSAVAWLISKGIESKRLVAKGYGETRLVNGCTNGVICTEEEHQQNRRTEIKVLKY